jgi:hypothetical protein
MVHAPSFLKSIPEKHLDILYAINRLDQQSLYKVDSIVVPDSMVDNLLYYSPFPQNLNLLDSVKKIIFLHYPIQAFAIYECGKMTRWGPVSMGRKAAPTPSGLFYCNWRSKRQISTIDPSWIMNWYLNIENFEGISIHQYALPGYPASHGCVRMLEKDAYWLYHWADQWKLDKKGKILSQGTPVIIAGKYQFDIRHLWKNLPFNSSATHVSPEEMEGEIKPFIQNILKQEKLRSSE